MKRLIYIIPTLIVFLWIIVSCTKESEIWREETSLVNSAKSWYELAISADPSNKSPLEPIWDKAVTTESGTGEKILIVPANGGRKANNPDVAISTSIGFKAKGNQIVDANIIQVLGDEEYINKHGHTALLNYKNRTVEGLDNGSVLFYDIYHNYLNGKSIKNGKVVKNFRSEIARTEISISTGSRNTASPNKVSSSTGRSDYSSTFSTQGETICTDWYWTTWNTYTGQVISEQYLYTTCTEIEDGNGSGGNNSASLNKGLPCPDSFHFVTKISADANDIEFEGGWQIAATDGIAATYVTVGGTPPPVVVQMPRLYFGLPVILANGSTYSYELAQAIAIEAVQNAERKAYDFYRQGAPSGSLSIIFKEELKRSMQAYGGRVNETPGINITIPQKDITVATYPGLFGC